MFLIRVSKKRLLILILLLLFFSVSCITYKEWMIPVKADESYIIKVPILMYHEVKPNKPGKDVITPAEFEADLIYLKENGYHPIDMTQLIGYVYEGVPLPSNPVILTFDDGYYNNYRYVFPLLKKYQVKIVMSVLGKNADDFSRYPSESIDYAHATWDQIKEMSDSGLVEIQNHTYNLHKITDKRYGCRQASGESLSKYEQVLINDIMSFQEEIYLKIGAVPNTFTYPYGKKSKTTDNILKKLNFKATLSCDYGMNFITVDPEILFGLKRICRSHGQNAEKLLTEAYKLKKQSD